MSRSIALVLPLAAILALVLARPAAALPDGERVTLTPSAGYLLLSERSNVDPGPFFGGSVGFMFNRNWGVEGSLGYVLGTSLREFSDVPELAEGNEVDARYIGASVRYQAWHERDLSPYVSAGWTRVRFTPTESTGIEAGTEIQRFFDGYEAAAGLLVEITENEYHRTQARIEAKYLTNRYGEPYVAASQWGGSLLLTGSIQVELGDNWHRDTDRDGIIDRNDNCADTAEGVIVDAQGCPIDSDGDGVFDGIDVSADTPMGAVVDSLGVPLDEDQDGVYDGLDQCPTPIGAVVDERGCGIDSDGDRVFDGIDQCPGTPTGIPIDSATGCPRVSSPAEREFYDTGLVVLSDIEFESGSAEMSAGGTAMLRPIAQYMRKWPEMVIEVSGHTDDRGSLEANQRISQERAQTVVDYLVDSFDWIDASRLNAVGYGEERPIADNATEEGRGQNRRVEFRITAGQPQLPE